MPPPADPPEDPNERTVVGSRTSRAPGQRSAAPGRTGSAWRSAFDSRAGRGGSQLSAGIVLNNTHRIEALVARGGMGEVYRATNLVTGDTVAVKTVRPEFAGDPKISELFRREAASLRKVHNPAVVYYEGAFFDDSGQLYLVMEFCDGPSLATMLHSGPLPPAEIRRLRDRLAAGLAAAHAEGVIHRDISPENVILPGGRLDDAKLIDFGIARQQANPQSTLIGTDFAGKYAYVSPEQLGLHGGKVDGRSDIYSLGLVLAAMAAGRQLEMGDSPGTAVEARRLVPDLSRLPAELRDEIGHLLQPNPEQRPPSMAALVAGGRVRPHAKAARTAGGGGLSRTVRNGAIALAVVAVLAGGAWIVKDALWPPFPQDDAQRLERERVAREEQQRQERERVAREEQQRQERERQTQTQDQQRRQERERLERERLAQEERERQQQVNIPALKAQTLAVVSRQQQCGWLLADVSNDARVVLDGFVGRDSDRAQLVGALEQLRGVRAIEDRRVVPSWAICDLLQAVRPPPASEVFLSTNQNLPIRVLPSIRTYRVSGEMPSVRVLLDPRAGSVVGVKSARVVVIGADGTVSAPAAWVVDVGDDPRTLRFEASGAALARTPGPAIVLALLSQNPLFPSPRPPTESATQFFFALRLALQANPDTRAAFTIINFTP